MTLPGDGASEPPLPLRKLDFALRPIRRVVSYAMRPGARPRFVEANVARHLAGVAHLDLPTPLREHLQAVAADVVGFDNATEQEQQKRLGALYAGLARIDALAGLPLPQPRWRPLSKPQQVDEPEPVKKEAKAPASAKSTTEKTAPQFRRSQGEGPPA